MKKIFVLMVVAAVFFALNASGAGKKSKESRGEEIARGVFGKCSPPGCIDVYLKAVNLTIRVIGQETVGANGSVLPFDDHKDAIQNDLIDKLKKKLDVGGNFRHLEKDCDNCDCLELFKVEKNALTGKGEEKSYQAKPVTIYVDKDGKVISGADGASAKIKFEVTITVEYYGKVGVCVENDTA
jgi:hypothetical protein